MLNRESAGTFINAKPQFVYELRRHASGLLEATYMSEKPAKTQGYRRPGLTVADSVTGLFEASHFPMRGTFILLVDGLERFGREGDLSGGKA